MCTVWPSYKVNAHGSVNVNANCFILLWAQPVMAGHLVVFPLGKTEGLEHALRQPAHAEEPRARHTDHIVVARVERHLAHGDPGVSAL